MGVILYARFSPRPNAQECDSADRQLEEMRRWCRDRGHEIIGEFRDEGVSGAEWERLGLFDAIRTARRGDVILVRDWDRLARDRLFASIVIDDCANRGVSIVSATESGPLPDSAESRLLRNILLDIAEYRRGIIAARVRAGMRAHQRAGRSVGGNAPYGWKRGPGHVQSGKTIRLLLPDQAELGVIEEIADLRALKWTQVDILHYLNVTRTRRRGGRWNIKKLRKLIHRDPGTVPPLDSPEIPGCGILDLCQGTVLPTYLLLSAAKDATSPNGVAFTKYLAKQSIGESTTPAGRSI